MVAPLHVLATPPWDCMLLLLLQGLTWVLVLCFADLHLGDAHCSTGVQGHDHEQNWRQRRICAEELRHLLPNPDYFPNMAQKKA